MLKQVSTRCPATGKPVPTGIASDSDSFHRIPFLVATESCPACGAPHSWRKSDTQLIEPMPTDIAA
jgi:endogenous inhibitor of DNA gyrase (YacG/DUF329 family)